MPVDRVIHAGGRVFEVGGQRAGRRADAEEVVHVDGAALGLRHPLRDERNRGDAAGAGEGRHAGAVAPDPGFEREGRRRRAAAPVRTSTYALVPPSWIAVLAGSGRDGHATVSSAA